MWVKTSSCESGYFGNCGNWELLSKGTKVAAGFPVRDSLGEPVRRYSLADSPGPSGEGISSSNNKARTNIGGGDPNESTLSW